MFAFMKVLYMYVCMCVFMSAFEFRYFTYNIIAEFNFALCSFKAMLYAFKFDSYAFKYDSYAFKYD